MKKFILLILLFLIVSTVAGGADDSPPAASPAKYAYALRFNPADTGEQYLARFDVEKNILLNEIKLPRDSGFNNFTVDEFGGCYIAKYRTSFPDYGEEIYYYHPKTNKIKLYYRFRDIFGPRHLMLTKEHLIALVYGNRRTRVKNGIVFINRQTKKIDKEIFFKENDPECVQFYLRDFFFDKAENTIYFTTDVFRRGEKRHFSDYKNIYLIDTVSKKFKGSIQIAKEDRYAQFEGLCVVQDNIYVAPQLIKRRPGDDSFRKEYLNENILALSLKGKILKSIKVLLGPRGMVYDPDNNKLFVWAANYMPSAVKIIDTRTNKVVGELPGIKHIFMASLVAPGKLYVTVSDYKDRNAIVFFDTKTNKILGSAFGVYTGISR